MKKISNIRRLAVFVLFIAFTFSGLVQAADAPKIDINKATLQELVQLKGIGKTYAERIIEYREKNGKFEKVEDIMKVKGIGQKKFEAIKDLIIVKLDK